MKIFVVFAAVTAVANAGSLGFGGGSNFRDGGSGNNNNNNNGGYSNSNSFSGGTSSSGSSMFGMTHNAGENTRNEDFGNDNPAFLMGFLGRNSEMRGPSNSGVMLGNAGRPGVDGGLNQGSGPQQGSQVRRFVSVHVAPEENVVMQPKVIRVGPEKPETHFNIVFIKAPVVKQQPTEVVLPEPPTRKTLVYLLIKKPDENQETVKIIKPPTTKPSVPEVFFIKYKDGEGSGAGGKGGPSGGNSFSNNEHGTGGFGSHGSGTATMSGDSAGSLSSSYGPPSGRNSREF